MLGELRRPEAETVVVFAGENETLHAGFLGGANDLLGVEGGGVENFLALIAVAPFLVGERVHSEMQEAIELHFVPAQLAFGGDRTVGQGSRHVFGGAARDRAKAA